MHNSSNVNLLAIFSEMSRSSSLVQRGATGGGGNDDGMEVAKGDGNDDDDVNDVCEDLGLKEVESGLLCTADELSPKLSLLAMPRSPVGLNISIGWTFCLPDTLLLAFSLLIFKSASNVEPVL